jgi:hypothetical protein
MPETVSSLFYIVDLMLRMGGQGQKVKETIELALKCIQEFANVRISGFTSIDAKKSFTENFSLRLVSLLSNFK